MESWWDSQPPGKSSSPGSCQDSAGLCKMGWRLRVSSGISFRKAIYSLACDVTRLADSRVIYTRSLLLCLSPLSNGWWLLPLAVQNTWAAFRLIPSHSCPCSDVAVWMLQPCWGVCLTLYPCWTGVENTFLSGLRCYRWAWFEVGFPGLPELQPSKAQVKTGILPLLWGMRALVVQGT